MFEETRKYTEEVWCWAKEELAQRLDLTGVVLDAVWKQVEDYRALLRRSFCFDDLHADIVMTRARKRFSARQQSCCIAVHCSAPFLRLFKKASCLQGIIRIGCIR